MSDSRESEGPIDRIRRALLEACGCVAEFSPHDRQAWEAASDAEDLIAQQRQEIERLKQGKALAEGQLEVVKANYEKLDDAIQAWERKCAQQRQEIEVLKRERDEQQSRTRLLRMALEQAIECIEHTTSMPVEAALAWFKKVLRGEV